MIRRPWFLLWNGLPSLSKDRISVPHNREPQAPTSMMPELPLSSLAARHLLSSSSSAAAPAIMDGAAAMAMIFIVSAFPSL